MAKYRPDQGKGPNRGAERAAAEGPRPTLRLDKWLWQARFFRARPMACAMIAEGSCRVNGNRCLKPGFAIGPGDTLTFPQGRLIRLIRVVETGTRRGPAAEARGLYIDLDPPAQPIADDGEADGTETHMADETMGADAAAHPPACPLE